MTTRILFVCLGNICRSPAAEAVFCRLSREAGLDVRLDSAGTAGYHVGNPPYGPMQEAGRARGYDLSHLWARQFGAADFDDFDLLIGMDKDNVADMESKRPKDNATPIRLLTDFAPKGGVRDIPDPYYTRDFAGALELIEAASAGFIDWLQKTEDVEKL